MSETPKGWKLVPIEPTEAMVEAGRIARMNIAGGYDGPSGWQAMLGAAPGSPADLLVGWEAEEKLTVEEAWTILCETPDITSPEEYPDHALITMEQLGSFMARARHHALTWEPIETAPRDGTVILLCGGAYHGYPFPGKWDLGPFSDTARPWVSVITGSRLYEHVPQKWMALAYPSTVNNPATLEKSDFQKFDVEGERQENERETTKQQYPSPIEKMEKAVEVSQ